MNDYISKPVDERLLYGKIVDLLKKPVSTPAERSPGVDFDLTFLKKQTKNNHTPASPSQEKKGGKSITEKPKLIKKI